MRVGSTILGLAALLGVVGVQAAAVLAAWGLGSRERFLRRYLGVFVSAAVGVLLATAVLHLLPEALSALGNRQAVWLSVGGTILALFFAERIFHAVTGARAEPEVEELGDCHDHHHAGHGARPHNIVVASMLHSFVDGAAVAAAFAAGSRIGWLTTFAIALHEIPHRMGDFALFVHLKVSTGTALRLAILAGVPSLFGVLFVVLLHAGDAAWLLPISAGSFLYIALVNLLPEMQHEVRAKELAIQLMSLLAGVGLVVGAAGLFPS